MLLRCVKTAWLAVDHRVRRGRDLAVVDDRVGLELARQPVQQLVVAEVEDVDVDRLAGHLMPGLGPLREVEHRRQAVAARLSHHLPAEVVVGDCDIVAMCRQTHRRGPPEVAVASEDEYSHRRSLSHQAPAAMCLPLALTPF